MVSIDLGEINWLAVGVAALAAFLIAGAWYGALFGKAWSALLGFSDEQIAEMKRRVPPPVFFGVMLASYLVLAVVMAIIAAWAGVASVTEGTMLGALLWLGPAAAIGLTGHVAVARRAGVFFIDAGAQLTYLLAMGAIIGGWR